MTKTELGGEAWWWIPQRMMSNSVPECEKDNLTGYVSFYTQWIDICVCIRVRGLHLFFPRVWTPCRHGAQVIVEGREEQSDGGEKNKETNTTQNQQTPQPRAHRPCLHHHVVFPLCKVKHVRRKRVSRKGPELTNEKHIGAGLCSSKVAKRLQRDLTSPL